MTSLPPPHSLPSASVTVFIRGLITKTPNGSRGHWSVAYTRAKRERHRAKMALVEWHELPGEMPYVVTITRCAPLMLDDDNAVAAAKHVRDGIADYLGINDRDPRVTWRVEQRKSKRGEAGTEIRIERRT